MGFSILRVYGGFSYDQKLTYEEQERRGKKLKKESEETKQALEVLRDTENKFRMYEF